ncbi:DsbA family oxidoreductase [Streptomyces nigra]
MRVDIWSDISCPWCFIGKARFKQALASFPHRADVEVVHRSFELDPHLDETRPTTGDAHAKKYGMTPAQARAAEERIGRVARQEGLGYLVDHRDHGNTFDMHRLLHLAAAHGVAEELLSLFYEGNFATARTLYDAEHQIRLAVRAGLDEDQVRGVLADKQAYAAHVRKDEAEAARLGVTGVPFFVIGGKYGLSGAQPTHAFTEALEQAWAEQKPELRVAGTVPDGGCDTDGACALPSSRP